MPSSDHVKEAMESLLKLFKEENLETVARAVFKGNNIPSDNWSFLNRLLMYLNNTEDARGFNQWKQAGRFIKKGSKALYILAPILKTMEEITESGTVTKQILIGFKAVPVFRFEDTDGEPIISEGLNLEIPYQFDSIINELGLTVTASRFCGSSYGSYNPCRKEIKLASPDIEIFLHELAHAVDDRLNGLKAGQYNDQEVTAEFSGAVIGHLMGYRVPMGNVREYIEHYSFKELLSQLSRIEKVVSYVIERTGAEKQPVPCMVRA